MKHYFFVESEDGETGFSTNDLKELFSAWNMQADRKDSLFKIHMEIIGEDGSTVYETDFVLD